MPYIYIPNRYFVKQDQNFRKIKKSWKYQAGLMLHRIKNRLNGYWQ